MQNCRGLSQIKTEFKKIGFDPEDLCQDVKAAESSFSVPKMIKQQLNWLVL